MLVGLNATAVTVESSVCVRLCSGVNNGHGDRPVRPRGARAGRLGPRAQASRAERALAVGGGAVGGLRAHRARARRLGHSRRVPRAQGTHTLAPAAHRRAHTH